MVRVSSLFAGLLLLLAPAAAQDTKALADDLVDQIRRLQNGDGTYGSGLEDTARVLDLLTRSPRRYTDMSGPFFRRAALALAKDRDPRRAARRALAFAGVVTGEFVAARREAVDTLQSSRGNPRDFLELVARSTYDLDMPRGGGSLFGDPAVSMLTADDPAMIDPPSVRDTASWARWARAALLLDVTPEQLPDPPRIQDGAPLSVLMDQLELVIAMHPWAEADDGGDAPPLELPAKVEDPGQLADTLDRALAFLEAHQEQGRFGLGQPDAEEPEPGVTALCLSATIQLCATLDRPVPTWVEDGLDWLASLQRPDGSIQLLGLPVYTTSVAVVAFSDAGREEDEDVIARAREFLVVAQSDEGEQYDPVQDPSYGGIGYGGDERPDLSNTHMALEAASRAGLDQAHPFWEKALGYVQRCQNLSEVNTASWPRDEHTVLRPSAAGGATYMPGNSPAGEDEWEEPGTFSARSYGSMTFALTKSYLLTGVPPDDVRVKSALRWLNKNFTVDENPGFSDEASAADGLFYYYMAMARTLDLLGDEALAQALGKGMNRLSYWPAVLQEKLKAEQRVDGSWTNEASQRWFEGSPTLCTAYASLALIPTIREGDMGEEDGSGDKADG